MSQPIILGINYSHNGSACILKGSNILVAIQEERLNRDKKSWTNPGRPSLAVEYCLKSQNLKINDIDVLAICEVNQIFSEKIEDNPQFEKIINTIPLFKLSHHLAHAYSVHSTTELHDSAIMVIDGQGTIRDAISKEENVQKFIGAGVEKESLYMASNGGVICLKKYLYKSGIQTNPDFIGIQQFAGLCNMYESISEYIFNDFFDAGKVMGLAPYGRSKYSIENFLKTKDDQIIFTNEICKNYNLDKNCYQDPKAHRDLAASVQSAFEYGVIHHARNLKKLTGMKSLCYAGGGALNISCNQRLLTESGFESINILPAAEDSGICLGAAYFALSKIQPSKSKRRLISDFMGKEYSEQEILKDISSMSMVEVLSSKNLSKDVASILAEGHVVGWYEGGAELGPRSLGHRAILCDPRRADAKDKLNEKVKFRESFRPFAPIILEEDVDNWFELVGAGRLPEFMLCSPSFKKEVRSLVPGVVHSDGTGRCQTVNQQTMPRIHCLLNEFKKITNIPLLINTSMNVKGEPIVEKPIEALWCLVLTGMDFLVLGNHLVKKKDGFDCINLVPKKIAERSMVSRNDEIEVVITKQGLYDYDLYLSKNESIVLKYINSQDSCLEIYKNVEADISFKEFKNTISTLKARKVIDLLY
jgi:carbamoyltransferase